MCYCRNRRLDVTDVSLFLSGSHKYKVALISYCRYYTVFTNALYSKKKWVLESHIDHEKVPSEIVNLFRLRFALVCSIELSFDFRITWICSITFSRNCSHLKYYTFNIHRVVGMMHTLVRTSRLFEFTFFELLKVLRTAAIKNATNIPTCIQVHPRHGGACWRPRLQ
jgi:hypothetical protein